MLSVSLQYQILKDDYAAHYNHTMWSSEKQKKQRLANAAKQIGMAAFYIFIYYYAFKRTFTSDYAIAFIVVFIGMILLSVFGKKNAIDKQLAKFLDNPDNSTIFTEQIALYSDNNIFIKSEHFETKINWKSIINKVETNTHYFLYTNSVQALIIPKRAFINNEQKITFDKILSGTLSLSVQLNDELKNAAK